MPLRAITSLSVLANSLTEKMPGVPDANTIRDLPRTPRLRKWSSARYMIFCGAPRALDRRRRVGEDRRAPRELLQRAPRALAALVEVVRADAVAADEVGAHALDRAPVELDADGDDQVVVADPPTVAEDDLVVRGSNSVTASRIQRRLVRDHVALGVPALLLGHHAGADQRPERLVVVRLRRLDDRDVGIIELAAQLRRGRDAAAATTDDDDLVMTRRPRRRRSSRRPGRWAWTAPGSCSRRPLLTTCRRTTCAERRPPGLL